MPVQHPLYIPLKLHEGVVPDLDSIGSSLGKNEWHKIRRCPKPLNKNMATAVLETATFGFEDRRAIHCATLPTYES